MTALLSIALAFALWMPPPASAQQIPSAWQRKALETAQRAWNPVCGRLSLNISDPATALVVDDAPSRAGQAVPANEVMGFTATGSCSLGISTRMDWRQLRYPAFCDTVMHEAGRAAGRTGTDAVGVMSTIGGASRDISRTWRHGRWHRRVIWSGVDRRCIRPMDRR
jgi:hypothetical protein